jgi:hypothetical protein
MAMNILKETGASRSAGYAVASGVSVYGGLAMILQDAQTITLFSTNAVLPQGLAIESNVIYPAMNLTPGTDGLIAQAGQGNDYLNYNRQGLISLFRDGIVELYDDLRAASGASSPINTSDTFSFNVPVYATATTGVITVASNGGANVLVGRVLNSVGTGSAKVVTIVVNA